jgi:hypothetical protein
MMGWLINNELKTTGKDVVVPWFEVLSWYFLGRKRKTTKYLSQDRQSVGHNLNPCSSFLDLSNSVT